MEQVQVQFFSSSILILAKENEFFHLCRRATRFKSVSTCPDIVPVPNFYHRNHLPGIRSKRLFPDHSYDLLSPGPSLTTLTLVDHPGAHFANDDQRMNHVTQQLVLEYIKKNTKSIIVIVSEVGDPTGDSAINLVMTQAQDFRTRTICVLTKPDKLRMEDDMGKKVALNQSSFTLEDGRFIVFRGMIRGQQYPVLHLKLNFIGGICVICKLSCVLTLHVDPLTND